MKTRRYLLEDLDRSASIVNLSCQYVSKLNTEEPGLSEIKGMGDFQIISYFS